MRLLGSLPVMVLVMAATVTPWTVRNWRVHGCFVPITTQSGWVLYESANPEATGGPWAEGRSGELMAELSHLDEIEWNRELKRRALGYIRENPGRMLKLAIRKQLRFWSPVPNAIELRTVKYMIAGLVSSGTVLVLAAVGIVDAVRKRLAALVLLGPVIWFALVHCLFLGSIRYRLPVDPFLIMLAAHGTVTLWCLRRSVRGAGARIDARDGEPGLKGV